MPMVPVDTAIQVIVGPLIDDTDFKSLETGVAYNAAGMSVDLIKSSITGTPAKTDLTLTTAGSQDWVELGNGMYYIEITAAQNDTEGELQVVGVATGILPFISAKYQVVPTAVYNSLVAGSDTLQADVTQVGGQTASATGVVDFDDLATIEAVTTAIGATGTGLSAIPWNASWDAEVQSECTDALNAYDPPTKAELDSGFAALNDPTAAAIADAVWDESTVGHTTAGTFGEQAKTDIDAILADTNELQTDDVPGLIAALNDVAATDIVSGGAITTSSGAVTTVTNVTNEVSADVTKISGDATAADNLEASLETLVVGTATGGDTGSVQSAVTGHGDDTFIGRVLIFRTGTLQYEAGEITDYDSTTGTFTFAASTWTTSPTTETFVIV